MGNLHVFHPMKRIFGDGKAHRAILRDQTWVATGMWLDADSCCRRRQACKSPSGASSRTMQRCDLTQQGVLQVRVARPHPATVGATYCSRTTPKRRTMCGCCPSKCKRTISWSQRSKRLP
jgi:hypothetical protein